MTDRLPVLICGAGPTGLTTALLLSRAGVECRIVDRREEPSGLSRATGLNARSLELLSQLEAADELLATGVPLTRNSYLRGTEVIGVDDLGPIDSDMPSLLAISETAIEDELARQLATHGVSIERGVEVADTAAVAEGTTVLRRADGSSETVSARWVVDAEGAHSGLRDRLGITLVGHEVPGRWVAADIVVDGWPFDPGDTPNWLDSEVFWAQPLPEGTIRVFFRHEGADLGIADVQAQIDRRFPVPTRVSAITGAGHFSLAHRFSQVFRKGSVFLAGDASHQCSPIGGRGMNLGIQDAVNLAWKLAAAERSSRPEVLLDSYDAERRPADAAAVAAVERSMARLMDPGPTPERRWGGASRDEARQANNVGRDITTRYLDSPVIDYRDHREGPLVPPGARVPNAALSRTGVAGDVRQLLGAGTHLIIEVAPDGVPAAAGHRVTVDPESPLGRVLSPGRYVVRPDGVLGCVAPPGDDDRVPAYFTMLGLRQPD